MLRNYIDSCKFHCVSSAVGIVDMTVGDVIEGRDTKVCAEVVDPTLDCPVGFPFNVALSFYNGNSDGMSWQNPCPSVSSFLFPTDKVLVFAECDRMKCVDIPIPDDSSVGQKNFTLHATLEGNTTKLSLLNSEIVKQVQENDSKINQYCCSELLTHCFQSYRGFRWL